MVLNLKCPSCGHSQRASEEVLGQKIVCPSCGAGFRVSAPKTREADAPAAPVDPAASGEGSRARSASASTSAPGDAGPGGRPSRRARPAAGPSASLPPWIYAALGGVGVMALIGVVLLARLAHGHRRRPARESGRWRPRRRNRTGITAAGRRGPGGPDRHGPDEPTETASPGDVVATATLAGLSTADKNPRPIAPNDPAPGAVNPPAAAESPAPAPGGRPRCRRPSSWRDASPRSRWSRGRSPAGPGS